MADDFRAKVTAELDTAEAESKLNAFLNEKRKLKIDVEVNQDSAKKMASSIEKGIKAISKKYGISVVSKTDWKCQFSGDTVDNFPLKVHMEQILSNLKKIISVTGYESSENIPSSFDKMDIYKMNNIEKIINDLELL